jgi:hypothetical protein
MHDHPSKPDIVIHPQFNSLTVNILGLCIYMNRGGKSPKVLGDSNGNI